jgi:DNA transformation protein
VPRTSEVRAQDRPDRASTQNSELEFRVRTFHTGSILHTRIMPHSNEYLEYVLEQLSGLPDVRSRRMFSGAGLYQDEVFFGLLFNDTLYFKVDDSTRPDYESRGMAQFRPYEDRPLLSFSYYEVPAEVLEDRHELQAWARRSVQAAAAIQAAKAAKRAKRKTAKRKVPKRKQAKRAMPLGKQAKPKRKTPPRKHASRKRPKPGR